jgi:hypothetical protein
MTGYLSQYDEHPKWKILKIRILSSCGHFVEHWQKQIKMKSISLELHCAGSLQHCRHAPWPLLDRLQRPQPRPKPGEAEGRRGLRPGPPPSNPLPCTMPTILEAPEETHSTPRPSHKPPSTRAWPPWPERASNAARAPVPSSFWPRLPPTLRPIKGPADQTKQRTQSPATSQTCSLSPACLSSPSPAPPEWYWTSGAPPRPTTWEQAAAGNRRRRRTAADPARRRRALHPLRHSLAVEQSSLQRRWAPARAEEEDDREPSDLDPTLAYRFGNC